MDDETTEAPTKKQFEGFRKIDKESKNFYGIPNEWTDIMAEIDNLAELKIIEYIMRHTWGFKEHDTLKCITTDEFAHGRKRKDGTRMDKGTGLGTTGVKQGITKAVEHGYVICETDESDKGRIKKYYGLKMLPTPDLDRRDATMHSHDATTDSRDATPDSRNETTHSREETGWISQDDHRSEKETLEKHLEKNTDERTNGARQPNVSTSDSSSIHSSNFSLPLSPEVKQTYDLICQELYPNCPPNLTTKAIEHFTKLSKGVKTVEDIKSLVAYCRQEQPILKTSKIHPGNLVRWLDGWLQSRPAVTKQSSEQEEPIVADEELAEDLRRIVQAYHDDENFEMRLESVKTIKRQMRANNYDMCDRMANTHRKCLSTGSSIDDFLESLRLTFY